MANLLRGNDCGGCEYYESEANDYYYEWCHHPNIDDEDNEGNSIYLKENGGDVYEYVAICPIDKRSLYED